MIIGPEGRIVRVLESLAGRPGLRWMRGANDAATRFPEHFRWLDDVRNRVPRNGRHWARLPEDLLEVYHVARARARSSPERRAPDAWEVWNEPDFYFVEDSAADMTAVLKAAWWGVKGVSPETPVLMPSLAFRPSRYTVEMAHNGLASYTDGWNIHFYGWASDYASFLAQHRVFTRAAGIEGDWWVTEIGDFTLDAAAAGQADALGRQEAFHERVLLESVAAGVARHLPFALTHFVEASSDLGMTDPAGRWRPAMRALVETAALLQRARALPRWVLVHRDSGASVGMVLEEKIGDDEDLELRWWTILWSPGRPDEFRPPGADDPAPPLRLRLAIDWPAAVREIRTGRGGTVSLDPGQIGMVELRPERNLHFRTGPARFRLEGCRWVAVRQWLEQDVRIPPAARDALDGLPPRRAPSPVVVRFRPGPDWRADKPRQTLQLTGDEGTAAIQVHNFSEDTVEGEWTLQAPAGWSVVAAGEEVNAREIRGRVEVEGLSRREIPVRLLPRDGASAEPGRVVVRWKAGDGAVDQASVRVERERRVGEPWHRYDWRAFTPRPDDLAAWQVYVSGGETFTLEIREPSGPQGEATVLLPVPRGARESDVFTATLRIAPGSAGRHVFAQAFLMTASGETWRHGEWTAIPHDGLTLNAGLGDFAPTIWSRHRTLLFPDLREARWLALRFQAAVPGTMVEVDRPGLARGMRER